MNWNFADSKRPNQFLNSLGYFIDKPVRNSLILALTAVFLNGGTISFAVRAKETQVTQNILPIANRTAAAYRYYFSRDYFPRSILVETQVVATDPLRIIPKSIEVSGCDGPRISLHGRDFNQVQGVYFGVGRVSGPNEDVCNTRFLKFSFYQIITDANGTASIRRYEIKSSRFGVEPISTNVKTTSQLRAMHHNNHEKASN